MELVTYKIVWIDIYGGNIGNIYGGSKSSSRMSGNISIKLIGGNISGIISGTCETSGQDTLSNIYIYLLGSKLGENARIYGGFAQDTENDSFKGTSHIHVNETGYSIDTLIGFTSLNISKNSTFEVRNKLNHIGGIKNGSDVGELVLNGNSVIKVPSSSNISHRQIGWIRSTAEGNKIILSSKNAYLNLTSSRDNMHQNSNYGIGYPVELNLPWKIDNIEKTYLIRYENNKNKLDKNNFIIGSNLDANSVFGIDDGKLYSVMDSKYVPEESYMMIVKHSRKILGVQNSKNGANALQLTHAYGQTYGPYEDYSYWKFKRLPNGNYKIINNKSGLLLTVKDGSLNNNAYVVQHPDINQLSQEWIIEVESVEEVVFGGLCSNAYNVVIKNAASGKVLDLRGSSFSDGAPFIQYDNCNSQNQKFLLVKHLGTPLEQ